MAQVYFAFRSRVSTHICPSTTTTWKQPPTKKASPGQNESDQLKRLLKISDERIGQIDMMSEEICNSLVWSQMEVSATVTLTVSRRAVCSLGTMRGRNERYAGEIAPAKKVNRDAADPIFLHFDRYLFCVLSVFVTRLRQDSQITISFVVEANERRKKEMDAAPTPN